MGGTVDGRVDPGSGRDLRRHAASSPRVAVAAQPGAILGVGLSATLRAQLRGVDDLEVGAGEAAEAVEVVVRPARVGGAADVPGRAVVGQDHPVALERLEHDARLRREAADVEARLQPDAQAHRRERRVGRVARVVPGRIDEGAARLGRGEAERVVDRAGGDLVVAREAGEDRQARRRRPTSSRPAAACSSARLQIAPEPAAQPLPERWSAYSS